MDKKLMDMIRTEAAVPDNTISEAYEVFEDKSQQGDTMKINALDALTRAGLTEEDIFNMVSGGTGAGGSIMKALKGLAGKSGLKNLAGKISSKMKFPQGQGAPQSPRTPEKLPPFIQNKLNKAEPNPFKQEAIKKQEITKALDQLMQPNTVVKEEGIKGMRQFGKFNRQKYNK